MKKWFLLTIFVATVCLCFAADRPAQNPAKPVVVSDDDFWNEDWVPDTFPRMSEDRIDQLLVQIHKENPARADELEKLRKENIEKFRSQIRAEVSRLLRQPPSREGGHGSPQVPGQPREGGPGPDGTIPPGDRPGQQEQRGQRGEQDSQERGRGRTERMHDDFIAWMEKNYPEQAAALKKYREEKEPDKYMERVMEKMHTYDPIRQAERNNPKLAQVMKEDLELQKQRDDILRQLRNASDKDKEKLLAELKDVVSRRFDIIMARKQLQYDDLKKRLEELQKEVLKQEKELEKLKKNKDTSVKEYIDKLVNEPVKMNWD